MRWFRGFMLGLALFLLIGGVVYATLGNPASVDIGDVYVFRSVKVAGDALFFMREDVNYSPPPSPADNATASETWEIALYGTDGTTLKATRPLDYYQHSMSSLYFTPAQVTALGLGTDSAYYFLVRGMPSVFSPLVEGVNQRTRVLGTGDYYTLTSLGSIMITQAKILQADWGVTLVTSGDKLNATGATYFNKAIPGLNSIVPSIYQVSTSTAGMTYNSTAANVTDIEARRGTMETEFVQGIADILGVSYLGGAWFTTMGIGLLLASIMYPMTQNGIMSIGIGMGAVVVVLATGISGMLLAVFAALLIVLIAWFALHFIIRLFA